MSPRDHSTTNQSPHPALTWLHLQSDVILRVVHDVVEGPHGLVELLNIVNITVQVGVSAKVRPVDAVEFPSVVVTAMKKTVLA